jgi:hypothetical protein
MITMYNQRPAVLIALLLFFVITNIPGVQSALQHRPVSSFPVDIFASPKFEVSFPSIPIGIKEVELWRTGLRGGEHEELPEWETKGELVTPHSEAEGREQVGDENGMWTWHDLFLGTHPLLDLDSDLLESVWSDPSSRRSHGLEHSSYPRFITTKLPCKREEHTKQNHLVYGAGHQVIRPSLELSEYLCALPPITSVPPSAVKKSPNETQMGERDLPLDALEVFRALQPIDGTCLYHRQGWFTYA